MVATKADGVRNARSAVARIHELMDLGWSVYMFRTNGAYFVAIVGVGVGHHEHLCEALKIATEKLDGRGPKPF